MQTDHTSRNKNRAFADSASEFRRDQPKILTEHFSADLALANRARRAQRFPELVPSQATPAGRGERADDGSGSAGK